MDDKTLVERLRDRGVCSIAQNSCRNDYICEEAATRIEALEADLVEWKNQHENLLSVRQQDIAAMQAKIDTLEKELAFKNEAIRLTKGCPGKIVVRGGFYKIDCYKSKHSKQALEGSGND